jgi:hypothetical protein
MTNETKTNVQTFPVLALTHGETLKTVTNGTNGSMLAALT